jgi:uncharacterized protein YndB with AHSA1/START domain
VTSSKSVEFELERTIRAPIEAVFARLVDIEGHNEWMPHKGSIRKESRLTSTGEPHVGTTYVDETSRGTLPGEISELEAPTTLVYHWWDKTPAGEFKFQGWPAYYLTSTGPDETLVRHSAKLTAYGIRRFMAPALRYFAHKERTITIDALKASFESK